MASSTSALAGISPALATKHKPQRYQTLQVFRGLAALAVVGFHCLCSFRDRTGLTTLRFMVPGCSGVDFFFVLSGFIIFAVHSRDFGQPEKLAEFLRRRFVRVYPLYFLLSLLVIVGYAFHFGHYSKLNPAVLLKSFLLFPQAPGSRPILNPGWTLSHEMLFYCIFGALICLNRNARSAVVSIFVAFTLLNIVWPLPGPYWTGTWAFSPYNLEFFGGCVAAYLARFHLSWTLPIGLAGLSVSWVLGTRSLIPLGDGAAASMLIFFGVPYFLIVLGAASIERSMRLDPPPLLTAMGDATYSIYLSHFPIVSALTALMFKLPFPPSCIVIAIWALSASAGYAIYLALEKPLLHRMKAKDFPWRSARTRQYVSALLEQDNNP